MAVEVSPWGSLTKAQQIELEEGKSVMIKENVPNHPWPSFAVYQLVSASPLEAAAVFWDVEYASHYVPDCLKVSILNQPSANVLVANYITKMPIFANDSSVVRNEVVALAEGGYEVSWTFLKSRYSKAGVGSFLVVPHEGKTLLRYKTLVTPASSVAFLLKGRAQNQVQATVNAIAAQIKRAVEQPSSELLKAQVESLQKATASTAH